MYLDESFGTTGLNMVAVVDLLNVRWFLVKSPFYGALSTLYIQLADVLGSLKESGCVFKIG